MNIRNVNYTILPEFKLILECCKGKASVPDTIAMKQAEISDSLYNPDYNIIVDFREFESFIGVTSLKTINDLVDFLKALNIKSHVALLTTKPHQVVVTEILKELGNKMLTIKFDVFSTIESAIKYVDLDIENKNIIENKLLELIKNTA